MPIVGEFFETFLSEYAGDGQHWLDIKGFIEVLIKKKKGLYGPPLLFLTPESMFMQYLGVLVNKLLFYFPKFV